MNVRLENNEEKNKKLKILYITIIAICVLAIVIAVIIQIVKNIEPKNQIPTFEGSYDKEEFNNLFQNKVNYLENNSYRITRIDSSKEIVYTGYSNKNNKVSDYTLDVNIPYINIQNSIIDSFNAEIKEIFEKKAKDILSTQNQNIIYTINYSTYVSNNILSLVIRSTLKEGGNAERDIIQTYNYDLANQKEFKFEDMLELKVISRLDASRKIKNQIKEIEDRVNELSQLGYSIYARDSSSDIYDIDNITEYFLGENNQLYVIFAYGNQHNTSEMDVIIM